MRNTFYPPGRHRRHALSTALMLAFAAAGLGAGGPGLAMAQTQSQPASPQYTFDAGFLAFPVDLSMFADGNPVLPGVYRLDVYLNEKWAGKFDVRFADPYPNNPNDRMAQPCFDAALLDTLGFDAQQYAPEPAGCVPLAHIVAGTSVRFDFGTQKLMITAPQAVLRRTPRGFVDPKRWDAGIPALRMSYAYNGYRSKQGGSGGSAGSTQTSHYLALRSGLNLGGWRVRYRGTVNRDPHGGTSHQRDSLYVERGVPSLKSRLVVGESATSGQVFDSLSLLGAQLVSDARMRPDSQGAFVPILRGIAQTNARVTVHQRGEQIFEMTVPPGPFVIDDLYPNGRGGDLTVTIHEADGSTHTFTETYANLPEMLRPGAFHYSATVGRYRNRALRGEEPVLGQLTASYGLNNTMTGYGGLLLAAGYHSVAAGAGLNLPIGAVSADATWAEARAVRPDGSGLSSRGYAFKLGYTKLVPQLDTDVTLAMYRYATQGFYDPAQAFQWRDETASASTGNPAGNPAASLRQQNRRNQLAVRLSHQPGGKRARWGAFSTGISVQDYWTQDGRDLQYHFGWGRNVGRVSLGLTLSRGKTAVRGSNQAHWENQVMLTLSLPLGASEGRQAWINSSVTRRYDSHNAQASVSGTLGQRDQVSYSLFAAGDKSRHQTLSSSGGASVRTTTSFNRVGASVSTASGGARQISFSSAGALVAFRGGLVFSPEIGDTIGLVQAKNAAGAVVQGSLPLTVNAHGHAVVPYLQPYRENEVRLDPKGLSADVELSGTSQKVAPTDGAVVLLQYAARQGWAMLVSGKHADGTVLPFAAGVMDEGGRNIGYVAQGGRALIRTDAPAGVLTVRWGAQENEQCRFDYDLRTDGVVNAPDRSGFRRVEVVCE